MLVCILVFNTNLMLSCSTADTGDDLSDVPVLTESLPFQITREAKGAPLSQQEIADFTQTMADFYNKIDFFGWASRHSFGLADDNSWGQPGYKIWWTDAVAIKSGDTVTFTLLRPPDNTTAKFTRVLPNAIASYLATADPVAKKLAHDYIHGLSATMDGNIWGHEDPPITTIMARTIFHRNHSYQMEGGRKVVIDYNAVKQEDFARRHDTLHNPDNPTWGDIWVRSKRSKDDLPYTYRMVVSLIRLIRATDDPLLKKDALYLYRRLRGVTQDIVEHGYAIRTKDKNGVPFIPLLDDGVSVDDFACFTAWDSLWPQAECNTKLATALIAGGQSLGNDCEDGDGGGYEAGAIFAHYWSSNMIWGFHLAAVALSLAYQQEATAYDLLIGYGQRMEKMMVDPRADQYLEWYPDLAQLLILGAAYGLPLNAEEARLVVEECVAAANHYAAFDKWDLWDPSVPDGTHDYIPSRHQHDQGQIVRAFVRPPELVNLFEYCASPYKNENSQKFIDCEMFFNSFRHSQK
jgi:hypothetical protein